MPPETRGGAWWRGVPATLALSAGAGAIAALGQAPLLWEPALFLGIAAAVWLWRQARTLARAAWIGWGFGAGHFALALMWIVEPFLIEPERYGWMAPFALVFMAGGLALFWALGFALAWRLAKRGVGGVLQSALAFAGAMGAAELLRAYAFTGFPWAMLAHGLIGAWVAQGAAYVGVHGVQLALVLTVALAVLARGWALRFGALLILAGALLPLPGARSTPGADAPVIRLVQPNATQRLKWDPEMARVFYDRQIRFSAEGRAANLPRPDLVIWPETAVPILLEDAGPMLAQIGAAVGAPVLLGIQRFEGMRLMNSALVIGPDGAQRGLYDKHHLVPFGEYVPFGDLMAKFGIYGFAASEGQGYSAGPGPLLLDLGPKIGRALPLICYEAVFPQDVNAAPERPDLLVQITNDGWFGEISGPYQHLVQARFRAIEQGLPMVRVANTGVSAMIDPQGRVTAEIGLNTAGWVDAALSEPKGPTLYGRTGDWAIAAVVLLLLSAMFLRGRRLT